jgi:hypothetical protein
MNSATDFSKFGGVPFTLTKGLIGGSQPEIGWDFGWIPPERRDGEMDDFHSSAIVEMPEFKIFGKRERDDEKKVGLWNCAKAANNGQHFKVFYQKTGSCVGNGGGQATWYLSAVEVVRLKDPEQVLLPFYLLPYGRSRTYAGLRGRGDGSLGSAFAKAIRTDGIISADTPGLPKWDDSEGITWGASEEMNWSDGESIAPKWLEMSRKHLVQTTAQCSNADAVRDAIRNYYPCTIASNWGGMMKCPVKGGDNPVLLNSRQGTWNHQMSVIGWQDHPTLGELFCILNSWGFSAHGTPPDDAPPGSFWVSKADMDSIARQGETFAFSQFQGFPAQSFVWDI